VPIIYIKAKEEKINIDFVSGTSKTITGTQLDKELSSALFQRNNEINKITVSVLKK
jgi:hypothetical protein